MSINAIETLQLSCTTCPSECLLTVEVERDADGAVVEAVSYTHLDVYKRQPYASTKTCTFLHNKKAALTSGFSSIDNKKATAREDDRLC